MARARGDRTAGRPAPEQVSDQHPKASTAPWYFEATLKQEIQRRRQRRWRAASVVRMVARVVIPGSMVVVVLLCGILVLL